MFSHKSSTISGGSTLVPPFPGPLCPSSRTSSYIGDGGLVPSTKTHVGAVGAMSFWCGKRWENDGLMGFMVVLWDFMGCTLW